jgi:FAD dependent monooxygenase
MSQQNENGVKVVLADGSFEEGDLVIGADGVHSLTRQLMWDYATQTRSDSIPESDKKALFTEFKGIYGVSDLASLPSLGPAEMHICFGQDTTKLIFTQPGVAMWAIMYKDEYSQPPERYRPDAKQREDVANRFMDLRITDKIAFKDLWESKSRCGILNIEEGVLDKWHAGRIVLVGDSAHKVSPPCSSAD